MDNQEGLATLGTQHTTWRKREKK